MDVATTVATPDVPQHHSTSLSWRAWLVLLVYAGSLFQFALGSARTFTGHECLVAQIACEMVETGDWLVPRIDGKPWLEKPPLPHWIVALTTTFGGMSEYFARLPSTIAGLLGVVLIASLAARWYGPAVGLVTGLIQATTFYTITYARLAEADVYLWLTVTACIYLFARTWVTADRRESSTVRLWSWSSFGFAALLGLTQLSKGPLFGAVLAMLPCLGFIVLQRRWRAIGWFLHPLGLTIMLTLAVAWPLAIMVRYPEAYDLWWVHTFSRVGSDKVLNPKPLWYYFTTLPWQMTPWTIATLLGARVSLLRVWRDRSEADRFLWLWLLLPFTLLSLVSAKHHHYLIYALPPCSIWAATGLWRFLPWCKDRLLLNPRLTLAAVAALGVSLGGVAVGAPYFAPRFAEDCLVLSPLLALGLVAIIWGLLGRSATWTLGAVFALIWCLYGYVHAEMMWKTDRYREETALLHRLQRHAPLDAPIFVYGLEPSRLLLYSKRPLETFIDLDLLTSRARQFEGAVILTSVGHEPYLRTRGMPTCIDRMPEARWEKVGPFSQLAAFEMAWEAEEPKKDRKSARRVSLDREAKGGHKAATSLPTSDRLTP